VRTVNLSIPRDFKTLDPPVHTLTLYGSCDMCNRFLYFSPRGLKYFESLNPPTLAPCSYRKYFFPKGLKHFRPFDPTCICSVLI